MIALLWRGWLRRIIIVRSILATHSTVSRRIMAWVLVPVVLLCGCTLTRLNQQTRTFDASTVLVGRVEPGTVDRGTVIVGAYARNAADRWRVEHQVRLHEPGAYELIVPHGTYTLFAFSDLNGNGLYDAGEPSARQGEGIPLQTGETPILTGLDMVLDRQGPAPPRLTPAPALSTQAGALSSLDAPEMSDVRGREGYWQPVDFFRAQGGNVIFLQPYDPMKAPVLFVHGAVGSPQDWRQLIGRLDREHYQPWLFFYPSGAPAASMANLLYWKLLNLQLRWRFERLDIVAHSMGGLVVRRMLLDHGEQLPQIRRFVSLSTPWAGDANADLGVVMSPAVVPSWRDMQPEGAFMKTLFDRSLPPHIEYDLLFGHRGAPGLWRPNNDGTVTVASQLRRAAQLEARLMFGYDEDHTSILSSSQVAAQLAALLAADAHVVTGRLDVRLHYGSRPASGLPVLVLQPEPAGAPITAVLSAAEGGGRIAPLAPGRYLAGVLADGYFATPAPQTLTVMPNSELTVDFVMQPRGSLMGYVIDAGRRPAGSHQAAAAGLRPRSVQLSGPAGTRVLAPRAESEASSALARVLANQDEAWGPNFVFANLADGIYELIVEAAGYRTHRARVQVQAGKPTSLPPIVLQRAP